MNNPTASFGVTQPHIQPINNVVITTFDAILSIAMRRRFCVAPPSFRLGLHCSARRFHAQIRRTGSEWARAFYCIRAVVFFCVDFGLFELCRLRIVTSVLRRSPKLRLGRHCSARRFHAQMRSAGADWARAFYCIRAVGAWILDTGGLLQRAVGNEALTRFGDAKRRLNASRVGWTDSRISDCALAALSARRSDHSALYSSLLIVRSYSPTCASFSCVSIPA